MSEQLELLPLEPPKKRGRGRPPKPKTENSPEPHRARPPHDKDHPVHVTMRVVPGVPSLREWKAAEALELAIAKGHKEAFRIVHYSIQPDRLHLVIEAEGRKRLMRGLQGLAIRMARKLNPQVGREGRLFQERYRQKELRTPAEMRQCLVKVLLAFKKHMPQAVGVDPFSSGRWFDGWSEPIRIADGDRPREENPRPPVRPALTPLGSRGWRRRGLISPDEPLSR